MAYDGLRQSHRLATTTVTGAILAMIGDGFTQAATSREPTYDLYRGLAFAAFGATVTGPVNYVWLTRLAETVGRLAPAVYLAQVVERHIVAREEPAVNDEHLPRGQARARDGHVDKHALVMDTWTITRS